MNNEFIGYHFGCGGGIIPGWKNMEIEECDITKTPFLFESDSADACMASHVMEHVSGPDALRFLTECYRILKPGGFMRLTCPIIGPWLDKKHAIDLTVNHGHLCIHNEETLRMLLWMAGFSQRKIRRVDRDDKLDHHHKTIGDELDAIESCRLMAYK